MFVDVHLKINLIVSKKAIMLKKLLEQKNPQTTHSHKNSQVRCCFRPGDLPAKNH